MSATGNVLKPSNAEDNKALYDYQNQFNLLFREMDAAFALHEMVYDAQGNPKDYIFLDVNPAFEEHTGLKRNALLGHRVLELMPNTEQHWIDTYGQIAKTGEHIRFENYSAVLDRYFEISAYSPVRNYFAVIFRDITGIKKYELQLKEANEEYLATNEELEEALTNLREVNEKFKAAKDIAEENEALLSTIFNSAPVIMMLLNSQTEIESMNTAGLQSTGNKIESVIGLHGGDVFHCIGTLNNPLGCGKGELCKTCKVRGTIEECLQKRVAIIKREAEIVSYHSDGYQTTSVMISATPIRRKNSEYVLVTIDDITEQKELQNQYRKALERAEESDRLKSAFLANMSHEIRTPLNGILGFSDLLVSKRELSDTQRHMFSTVIKRSSASLLQIINDILDISRIESGELKVVVGNFEVDSVLTELHTLFAKKITENNKPITLDKYSAIPNCIVFADDMRFRQVLTNLLDNAIKFTLKGSIRFGIREAKADRIVFFVEDTGIGIPEHLHEVVFDRFRQGQETMNRSFGGNGLGLPIVRSLLSLMNGSIWLQSESGQGTTFFFDLPAGKELAKREPAAAKSTDTSALTGTRQVLLVEDDPASQLYMGEVLVDSLYSLSIAGTCADAWARFSKKPFDIILMDIQLPDGNGLDLVRKIRQTNQTVYIIAQTAYAMVSDERMALEAGCNDYVSKPVKAELLFSKLRKA